MKQVHPYVYAGLTTQYTINFELIKKTVLKGYNESEYSIIWEKLISTTRKRCNVIIRQKIIYLSYLLLSPNRPSGIPESIPIKKSNNMTLKDLGEAFNRDHSTISYSTKFQFNLQLPFIQSQLTRQLIPHYRENRWKGPVGRAQVITNNTNNIYAVNSPMRGIWMKTDLQYLTNKPIFVKSVQTDFRISKQ